MSTSTILRSVQQRITATLFISQSLFSASMILSFTLLPIISAHLSGTDRAAGIPPTMMMLGRAVAAYPVGWLMDRIGRRPGLSLGYLFAAIGSAFSVLAISMWESFPWLCAGMVLIGMGRGVSEQARFIAAEVYHPVRRAGVIGLIVFAGTIGAVGGPLLVSPSTWVATSFGLHAYAGPYLVSVVLAALALMLILLLLYPDPMKVGRTLAGDLSGVDEKNIGRKLWQIFVDRTVRLGVAAMIIGQFVMTLIMVITPLHMNHHAHGAQAISWVIMAHTLGMYGLSSLTSRLADRFGPVKIIVAGALILGVSAVLTPISNQVSMLACSLFLLGLGWNFCFIAGSALFFSGLLPAERGRAQGASEMLVALAAGTGSLGTGAVFAEAGIVAVSAMGLAFSLVLIVASVWRLLTMR
jgi:MFS family permease